MKYLTRYLWERKKLLAAILVALAALFAVFYLYDLPLSPLFYSLAVAGVISFFLFVLPGFLRFARRARELEQLEKNFSLPLPQAETLPEELFSGALKSAVGELERREDSEKKKQEEMIGYYTMWVHQIKTPLSAMRLILKSDGELDKAGREALLQELFKVERYVEMVLGYLRLETMTADLRLESCQVYSIVRQAVKKFAPQFIYQKLTLTLEKFPNRVVTDEKWLLFAIEQVLSNALKYTKSGSITISMDEHDVLTIADTGVGIPAEDLPRIFERGFTGYNGRQEKTSTGLGLYLTRQVLTRLNHTISIESTLGEGTAVHLSLGREELMLY